MNIKRFTAGICGLVFGLLLSVHCFADTMKPDIVDVQTTFKIGGVDKTKVVIATGSNTAIAMGVQSITGSSTFSSGLGTVTAVIATPDAIANDVRYVMGTSSGGNVTLKVYSIGAGTSTTLSSTPNNVNWLAVGTP